MFDPEHVLFTIRQFWKKKDDWGYRPAFLTVWHRDPCRDGSDHSCWNRYRYKRRTPETDAVQAALHGVESRIGNPPIYPTLYPEREWSELQKAWWNLRARKGPRIPLALHFWHWRIQFDFVTDAMNRLWRWRCERCGGKFKHGEGSPYSASYRQKGARRWWQRSRHLYHGACYDAAHVTLRTLCSATDCTDYAELKVIGAVTREELEAQPQSWTQQSVWLQCPAGHSGSYRATLELVDGEITAIIAPEPGRPAQIRKPIEEDESAEVNL